MKPDYFIGSLKEIIILLDSKNRVEEEFYQDDDVSELIRTNEIKAFD